MAAPNTAAAIALPILTLLAYLYPRATHRRPYNGIPYNPHLTRRLFGDMPELMAEAQRHRDPKKMLLELGEQQAQLCPGRLQHRHLRRLLEGPAGLGRQRRLSGIRIWTISTRDDG